MRFYLITITALIALLSTSCIFKSNDSNGGSTVTAITVVKPSFDNVQMQDKDKKLNGYLFTLTPKDCELKDEIKKVRTWAQEGSISESLKNECNYFVVMKIGTVEGEGDAATLTPIYFSNVGEEQEKTQAVNLNKDHFAKKENQNSEGRFVLKIDLFPTQKAIDEGVTEGVQTGETDMSVEPNINLAPPSRATFRAGLNVTSANVINAISESSPFKGSKLQVGQTIDSINGISLHDKNYAPLLAEVVADSSNKKLNIKVLERENDKQIEAEINLPTVEAGDNYATWFKKSDKVCLVNGSSYSGGETSFLICSVTCNNLPNAAQCKYNENWKLENR